MTPAPLWLLTYAGRARATSDAGRFPVAPQRVREQSLVWFGAPLSLTPSAALLADI